MDTRRDIGTQYREEINTQWGRGGTGQNSDPGSAFILSPSYFGDLKEGYGGYPEYMRPINGEWC